MELGRPRICVATTTSTMDLALRLAADGATTGTVVQAGHQTAGRGRAGRVWEAPPWSSLLISLIWHTNRARTGTGILAPLIGLAVAETVEALTGFAATVKWPNDVQVNGLKIAGILVVSRTLPGRGDTCLVAGIGLNVNNAASDLPATATSIGLVNGERVYLNDVREILLDRLEAVMAAFETGEEARLLPELDTRLAFRNEQVTIEDGPRRITGHVRGLAPDGALILEQANGACVIVVAGELTRGPRQRV
jgi:BirA family biotin operon repressor/biotin-[acetyl-CoA-carboxylase] ligase